MAFASTAVTIEWNRNNLIIRRGASQLLIDAQHVQDLRLQDSETSFNEVFRTKALQNREARRVFLAWERKDSELLAKIYKEVIT